MMQAYEWDACESGYYPFVEHGDPLPVCSDAANSNDDGKVNITDALYLIGYLFICSTGPPPEPFPLNGPDPTTEDGLDCSQSDA